MTTPKPKTRYVDLLKLPLRNDDGYWQRTLHLALLLSLPIGAINAVNSVPWSAIRHAIVVEVHEYLTRSPAQAASPRQVAESVPVEKSR